jgi:hypothetical protein
LTAPGIRLEEAVLDRIDEIVAPGTNVNPDDGGWSPAHLTEASSRRRPR